MTIDSQQTGRPEAPPPTGARAALDSPLEPDALDAVDLRLAAYVSVAMFAAGALLVPIVELPIRDLVDAGALVTIGFLSLGCAVAIAALIRAGRITLDGLYASDYAWVALTAALVAASGGLSSPFFLLYPLPVLHAGAIQSRRRMLVLTVVTVLAFLTPLLYDDGDTALFTAMAIIAVPPTVVVALSLNIGLTTLRRQRRELEAAEHEAQLQARIDPVTGLGNYRMLWSTLEAQTARARRHDERFSLILIDLDRFKAVNDLAGHREGDATLQAVGAALRGQLRAEDVCCRHGGDEFTVVAIGTGYREAAELADRLTDAVAEVHVPVSGGLRLGATAGWATFDGPNWTAESLMREADSMLRQRKYGFSAAR